MRLSDVMTRNVEALSPDTTLADAARRMRDLDVGSLPVVRDNEPVGMITDRDIVVRAVAEGRDLGATSVGEAMTGRVVLCRADESLEAAAHAMQVEQVRRLMVVDDDQRLVGIVSLGDLALRGDDEATAEHTLEDVSWPGHEEAGEPWTRRTARHVARRPHEPGAAAGAGSLAGVLAGAAMGAALMYLFDPDRGRRRRALIRDQMVSAGHVIANDMSKTARYTRDKLYGTVAQARSSMRTDHPSDNVLRARVRSAIGRATSHPSSIEVEAHDGTVYVRGPVLENEVDTLLDTIRSVRGVREVQEDLDVHRSRGETPGLQGGAYRGGRRWDVSQESWSPTTRLMAGALGAGLEAYAVRRRDMLGAAAGAVGLGLLMRSASNLPSQRLTGVGAGRRAVTVHKTIHVDVPVEQAFDFWSHWENFPKVMSHVREVRRAGEKRSHWVVTGLGTNVEWDAELTAFEPNRVIAWKSLPGAAVKNAGIVRFFPRGDGRGTKIEVQLSYNPPAGAMGHVLAKVFGADPKSEMDDDLMRMKTFLETGHAPHDAAQRGGAQV